MRNMAAFILNMIAGDMSDYACIDQEYLTPLELENMRNDSDKNSYRR